MQISTTLALTLTGIILAALVAIYAYLALRKWRSNSFARRKQEWLESRRASIREYLLTGQGGERIRPKAEHEHQAMEDFFSDYLSSYKTDSANNPVKDFVERYMGRRYRAHLRDRRWSVRVNTLYFIDLFKLEKMQNDLLSLLRHKRCSAEERYQIYLLLADFEYADLQDLLKSSKGLPPFLLSELTGRLVNHDNLDEYVRLFPELPRDWQLSLLDVFRDYHLRSERLQDLLEALVESHEREMRIRALKTIGVLGYVRSPEIVTRLVENAKRSGEWNGAQAAGERMMVARLMGHIRLNAFVPYLKELISDGAYNVRANAAMAIRRYENGRETLVKIANSHEDAFARNIAREWVDRSMEYE